ncbi:MAG: hypothetical protein ACRBDI_05760 [Alphaproteobacteria bacterium]
MIDENEIIEETISKGTNHALILHGTYDTGWTEMNLKNHFEEMSRGNRPEELHDMDFNVLKLESTDHLKQIIRKIRAASPNNISGLNQTYINFNGNTQSFHEHFVGLNHRKLGNILDRFAIEQPFITHIPDRDFVENLKGRKGAKQRSIRAATDAFTMAWKPSQETKKGEKKGDQLLFSSGIPYGRGLKTEGDLAYCITLDVKDPSLRKELENPGLVTITPYIRWETAYNNMTNALKYGETDQYLMIQGKITSQDQISRKIIDFVDENPYEL